jgi:Uma2 family endonuclease
VAAVTTKLTIDDFERLPDEQVRYKELVNGELVDVSGNIGSHIRLRDWLVALLLPRVEGAGLGMIVSEQEFDFDGNAHGPDVALIGAAKMSLFDGGSRIQRFVPDLVIEIISRNDTFEKVMEKASRYRRCGTREVWVMSQAIRQAFALSDERQAILGEDDFFESPQIPDFGIRLGELFDRA